MPKKLALLLGCYTGPRWWVSGLVYARSPVQPRYASTMNVKVVICTWIVCHAGWGQAAVLLNATILNATSNVAIVAMIMLLLNNVDCFAQAHYHFLCSAPAGYKY